MRSIQNRIYELRGERVMMDLDLAVLYEVLTKFMNQEENKNTSKDPKEFMLKFSSVNLDRATLSYIM